MQLNFDIIRKKVSLVIYLIKKNNFIRLFGEKLVYLKFIKTDVKLLELMILYNFQNLFQILKISKSKNIFQLYSLLNLVIV